MTEGLFKLKQTMSGPRHYIELPDGTQEDIHCGSPLEIRLGAWDDNENFYPYKWLAGWYEADLSAEKPKAFLVIGRTYPHEGPLTVVIPLGVLAR
ncbi:hypothetical protein [Desulfolucanica intricata]|uniref:hypothetical protein n=1 Tax=Desulfolucanica intricata TaxID=1285191 RepID=UPI0008331072|nr:hypothetical protein [Desulfolucanica intricata]